MRVREIRNGYLDIEANPRIKPGDMNKGKPEKMIRLIDKFKEKHIFQKGRTLRVFLELTYKLVLIKVSPRLPSYIPVSCFAGAIRARRATRRESSFPKDRIRTICEVPVLPLSGKLRV